MRVGYPTGRGVVIPFVGVLDGCGRGWIAFGGMVKHVGHNGS